MSEQTLQFESERHFHQLYGENPENLQKIETLLGLKIVARGDLLKMRSDEKSLKQCEELFGFLEMGREQGMVTKKSDFMRFLKGFEGQGQELRDLLKDPLVLKIRKKSVVHRNLGQRRFLDLILKNDLVFGIGPAGTGKTYLAMIAALHSLLEGKVQRIVLARPAVEAGEALGFLPGDLEEKLLPYLRPLYDAMDEVLVL